MEDGVHDRLENWSHIFLQKDTELREVGESSFLQFEFVGLLQAFESELCEFINSLWWEMILAARCCQSTRADEGLALDELNVSHISLLVHN